MEIKSAQGKWVILNFGNPDNVSQFLKDFVMPHFDKMLNKLVF